MTLSNEAQAAVDAYNALEKDYDNIYVRVYEAAYDAIKALLDEYDEKCNYAKDLERRIGVLQEDVERWKWVAEYMAHYDDDFSDTHIRFSIEDTLALYEKDKS